VHAGARAWRIAVVVAGGLAIAANLRAAPTLTLIITPSSTSFPDASPTSAAVIAANASVQLTVRMTGAQASDTWHVSQLASGDLISAGLSIGIENVTWTSTRTSGSCNNCSCQSGTSSKTAPALTIQGAGNTGSGVTCTQSYNLANSWTYKPGAYSQMVTITASAP